MRLSLTHAGLWCLCAAQGVAASVGHRHQHGGSITPETRGHEAHGHEARGHQPHGHQARGHEARSRRDPDVDPRAAAKAAIDSMNSAFFNSTLAVWAPTDPWWLSGVAITSVIDYMRKTDTTDYLDKVTAIFQAQRSQAPGGAGDFRAESTDDTGWWALAMVRMFDITGDRHYLDLAAGDEAYIYQSWSEKPCGGGIYVDIAARTYKNAIANELYIKLAAALHNRIPGDTVYLERAKKAWKWFKSSGMINEGGLINDGLASRKDGTCFNNGLPVWTYNQGVVLGALVELYHATSSTGYLQDARAIADAVLSSSPSKRGNPSLVDHASILTEGDCSGPREASGGCNVDQQIFKGVFMYNLAELDEAIARAGIDSDDGGRPYAKFLRKNIRSAYVHARGKGTSGLAGGADLYGVAWGGLDPGRAQWTATLGTQASALGLLISGI
ncbi:glycoside hydrolase [Dichotomopilus funicola]|uniref:Glycoside hydrolase n=1 Tax=Dichotomopilus funicola TaxID=1934379 RepID=A0AAN6ZPJ5_9PEZI|nr:glycoside hydrolase [Dichotomopilus funicola]